MNSTGVQCAYKNTPLYINSYFIHIKIILKMPNIFSQVLCG